MIRAHFPLGQENKNALSVDLTKKVLVFMNLLSVHFSHFNVFLKTAGPSDPKLCRNDLQNVPQIP
jgi:hypothetical protein